MLTSLFDFLDGHPSTYWAIAVVPTAALLALVFSSLREKKAPRSWTDRDWLFSFVIVVFVIAWRWPFFLASHEFNPDESQLISGAATLAHEPVFWRSIDGTTSGPLNFAALLPLHFLGMPLDYFSARLTAALLGGIALICCYRLFRNFAPPAAARLASLPAIFFFGTTTDGNFLHYSSEQASVALIGLASFGLLRRATERESWPIALGAIAAGLLPWAKLQTAPMGLALLGFKLWAVCHESGDSRERKWREARRLFFLAAAPSAIALLVIGGTGQWAPFFQGYLLQNIVYVGGGTSLSATVAELIEFISNTHALIDYWTESALLILLSGLLYGMLRQRPQANFYFGALFTATAVFCILAPRRPYPHYLLLSVLPLACWAGAAICQLSPHVRWRRTYAVVLLAIGCLLPLGLRLSRPVPEMFGEFAEAWRRPYSLPGTLLRAYTQPGEFLAVWGWRNDLFVESGLIQATRDPHTVWLIANTPNREYHRGRYLADLKKNRPEVFVDAVGPGAFSYFDRKEHGHEIFPELAAYIHDEYRLLVDLGEERIYLRRDVPRLAKLRLSVPKLQELDLKSRSRPMLKAPDPDRVEPADLTGWDINGIGVRSLHVPAKMTWSLSGTERQIVVEYGLHPRAYTEGQSNGADLIVELQVKGHPPDELFRRRLDPVRKPEDRGQLTTRITLPPYIPNTNLVIRTEAGDFNDAAWDWVYLSQLLYVRSPTFTAEQFPRFNRLPDDAVIPRSYLQAENGEPALVIKAPGELTYILEANESRMHFTYGSEPAPMSAASGERESRTTISVELRRANNASIILFERTLNPAVVPADRARTSVELAIPGAQPDDIVVLRIDSSGTGSAKPLVYVTDVLLK